MDTFHKYFQHGYFEREKFVEDIKKIHGTNPAFSKAIFDILTQDSRYREFQKIKSEVRRKLRAKRNAFRQAVNNKEIPDDKAGIQAHIVQEILQTFDNLESFNDFGDTYEYLRDELLPDAEAEGVDITDYTQWLQAQEHRYISYALRTSEERFTNRDTYYQRWNKIPTEDDIDICIQSIIFYKNLGGDTDIISRLQEKYNIPDERLVA